MSSVITGVEPGSLADIHQIRPGDILLKVNGKDITDVLDYRFYIADRNPEIEIREKGGALRCIRFEKEEYADIGLEFESYLIKNTAAETGASSALSTSFRPACARPCISRTTTRGFRS